MVEKRTFQRKPVNLDATVASSGLAVPASGRIRDLSVGGSFVVIDLKLPFGTAVELTVMFPAPIGAIAIPAIVRWGGDDGIGLQFGLLGARETHAIAKALTTIR